MERRRCRFNHSSIYTSTCQHKNCTGRTQHRAEYCWASSARWKRERADDVPQYSASLDQQSGWGEREEEGALAGLGWIALRRIPSCLRRVTLLWRICRASPKRGSRGDLTGKMVRRKKRNKGVRVTAVTEKPSMEGKGKERKIDRIEIETGRNWLLTSLLWWVTPCIVSRCTASNTLERKKATKQPSRESGMSAENYVSCVSHKMTLRNNEWPLFEEKR